MKEKRKKGKKKGRKGEGKKKRLTYSTCLLYSYSGDMSQKDDQCLKNLEEETFLA